MHLTSVVTHFLGPHASKVRKRTYAEHSGVQLHLGNAPLFNQSNILFGAICEHAECKRIFVLRVIEQVLHLVLDSQCHLPPRVISTRGAHLLGP